MKKFFFFFFAVAFAISCSSDKDVALPRSGDLDSALKADFDSVFIKTRMKEELSELHSLMVIIDDKVVSFFDPEELPQYSDTLKFLTVKDLLIMFMPDKNAVVACNAHLKKGDMLLNNIFSCIYNNI